MVSLKRCSYTVQQGGLPAADSSGSDASAPESSEEEEGGDLADEEEDPGDSAGSEDEDDELEGEFDAVREVAPAAAEALDAFTSVAAADPAAFLQPAAAVAQQARAAAKALYDYGAATAAEAGAPGSAAAGAAAPVVLQELHVQGFDPEQIWLQASAGFVLMPWHECGHASRLGCGRRSLAAALNLPAPACLQLELAAGPAVKRARRLLRKAGEDPTLLTPEAEEEIDGEGAVPGRPAACMLLKLCSCRAWQAGACRLLSSAAARR